MPKKILFESAVHHFVTAGRRVLQAQAHNRSLAKTWADFLHSLTFTHPERGLFDVAWTVPTAGVARVDFSPAALYTRGDLARAVEAQKAKSQLFAPDQVAQQNAAFFDAQVLAVARQAGLPLPENPGISQGAI